MVLCDDDTSTLKVGMKIHCIQKRRASISGTVLATMMNHPKTGQKVTKVRIDSTNTVRYVKPAELEVDRPVKLTFNRALIHVEVDERGQALHEMDAFDRLLVEKYNGGRVTVGGERKPPPKKFVAGVAPSYQAELNAWHDAGIEHFHKQQAVVPGHCFRRNANRPRKFSQTKYLEWNPALGKLV
jgi:hypothetical protein